MTIGLRIKGLAGNVQIDDQAPLYVVKEQGAFTGDNLAYIPDYRNAIASRHFISFKTPVASIEPPLVFLKFDTDTQMSAFTLLGGPGNWTGFCAGIGYIGKNRLGISAQERSGKWFAAVKNPGPSSAKTGVRIRSSITGEVIFDTGHRLVRFIKQSSDFMPAEEDRITHRLLRFCIGYPVVPGKDVYFLANMFTGLMNQFSNGDAEFMWCGIEDPYDDQFMVYTWGSGPIPYQDFSWTALFATIN